jgi:glycosyltransferase involved in cell wall biosynthesis
MTAMTMKPAVLLIGNFLSSSVGVPGVSEGLADKLAAAGWRVLTTSEKPGRLARVTDMLLTAWRRRGHYQVAHIEVYSGPAFWWAAAMCFLLSGLGKPYLVTLHGGNLPYFARKHPRAVRLMLGSALTVTAPSPYLLDQLRPYRTDIKLLPNPLNLRSYVFRHRERPAPNLVWVRAFDSIYNPSLAPRVLALLAPEFPDAHLTMVGPDKGDGSLQVMRLVAKELGVADRITVTGAVPKLSVPDWLARSDIFLNTTNVDNTPVSVLEAMACGLCIVSTNVGGIPYLLQDGCDALLTPPDDAVAMAEAVRRILATPGLAASLSRQARDQAERCDWRMILPQWEELLAAAGTPPAEP